MKNIKQLLFKSSRNSLIWLVIGILLTVVSFFMIGATNDESLIGVYVVVLILFGYIVLVALICFLIFVFRYNKAIKYFLNRKANEGLEVEWDEVGSLSKKFFYSNKYIVSTYQVSSFVLHKKWIKECNSVNEFKSGRYWFTIQLVTDDKTFKIQMNNEAKRTELFKEIRKVLGLEILEVQADETLASQLHTSNKVDFKDNSNGMNIIVFSVICIALVGAFALSYSFIKEKVWGSTPVVKNEDMFRDVTYDGYNDLYLEYMVSNDVTYIYVYNGTPYAFTGDFAIDFGDGNIEDITTDWIRPNGYLYVPLDTPGEPQQYDLTYEQYKQLNDACYLDYVMYPSDLTESYGYDIVLEYGDLDLETVEKISLDEARYTKLEDYQKATLLFHEMDLETFHSENPPEDLSTLKFRVEIDVVNGKITIYDDSNTKLSTVKF